MYLIDEAFNVGKGANSIILMLHNFFEAHGIGEKSTSTRRQLCRTKQKPVHEVLSDVASAYRST